VLRHIPTFDERIAEHVRLVLRQLDKEASRLAIGEADPEQPTAEWYPPNAYHTYWALDLLDSLKFRFSEEFQKLAQELQLERRMAEIRLWAKAQLATETALHSAKSPNLDSDQLAWSLAIAARFDSDIQSDLSRQDLFRHALGCLFETQKPVGTWRHYRPLFHYQNAGNAYCFVFETFAVLLRACLQRAQETTFFIDTFKPHFDRLQALLEYAVTTRTVTSDGDQQVLAWSSGHRTNKTSPESWATASVFDFVQCLRRMVGCWTRDRAFAGLNQVAIKREGAGQELLKRGRTWSSGPTVAEHLTTLFLNPFHGRTTYNRFEPDGQPISDHQARAAILFGPPGTSKTTLVRSLAGTLGWDYIEIHASHFVAQGLPNVQKTADEIFQRLMELDHTVVLFDEIDELVRERSGHDVDAFGRFLTTSMLPKLAELWHLRKILYFVATNYISYFDSAITRGGRFDALLLVPPPSFDTKLTRLRELLERFNPAGGVEINLRQEVVEKAFESAAKRKGNDADELTATEMLSIFFLLRWDQINELADNIATIATRVNEIGRWYVGEELVAGALSDMCDRRLRGVKPYSDFVKDRGYARRDHDKHPVYRVIGPCESGQTDCLIEDNGNLWLHCPRELWTLRLPSFEIKQSEGEPGVVEIRNPAI